MKLKRLYLRNFRNYTEEVATFGEGVNLIHGNNAQGKTNLLEAIYLLSTGRSFRTNRLSELIREGSTHFHLEASFVKEGIPQTVKLCFDGKVKEIQHNQTRYPSFTPLIGLLPIVLYHPNDIQLLMGAPVERRRFLNLFLAQSDPIYIHHLIRYHKAMKQRNELLRQKILNTIELWEAQMAVSASYLTKKRADAMLQLSPLTHHWMKELSSSNDLLEIKYQPSYSSAPDFFIKNRIREMVLGSTLSGPHRDDLSFDLQNLSMRSYASEGQKRSLLAALHFASWEGLKETISAAPLLGVDDFPVHLDQERQTQLFQKLFQFGQVFLTTPQLPSFSPPSSLHPLFINSGKVISE
jgi:DNA replication and repair protein RecF